jgi:hypothetical protein
VRPTTCRGPTIVCVIDRCRTTAVPCSHPHLLCGSSSASSDLPHPHIDCVVGRCGPHLLCGGFSASFDLPCAPTTTGPMIAITHTFSAATLAHHSPCRAPPLDWVADRGSPHLLRSRSSASLDLPRPHIGYDVDRCHPRLVESLSPRKTTERTQGGCCRCHIDLGAGACSTRACSTDVCSTGACSTGSTYVSTHILGALHNTLYISVSYAQSVVSTGFESACTSAEFGARDFAEYMCVRCWCIQHSARSQGARSTDACSADVCGTGAVPLGFWIGPDNMHHLHCAC